MGKAHRFLPAFVLFFLISGTTIAHQPLHWDATIDSAKLAAGQSTRLVLVLFSAPWCTACHHLENDLRNQPGAVAALEANFVPVKVNFDYYPNTAKQYGVTRLPTTVILAPSARGEVLAVIPEYLPVDQYLTALNKVAADAKQRGAAALAQIQAGPQGGAPVAMGRSPAVAVPTASSPVAAAGVAPPSANGPAPIATAAGPYASRPVEPQKPAEIIKPSATLALGLDGFCPVQLVENFRWQPGQKAWGAIHRGRTYLFTGAEEQRRFLANPDRYAPISSGDDVVLLLEQGRSVPGCREHGLQFDGHIYLFADEGTLDRFHSNPRYYADRALQVLRSANQTAAVR